MTLANIVFYALAAWFGVGLIVGLGFVLFRIQRVAHGAEQSSWAFRLMMLPGAMTLWPAVLRRWHSEAES